MICYSRVWLSGVLLVAAAALFPSCSKQNAVSPSLADGQSVVITDLPGDTAAAAKTDNEADTGIANFQTFYFSLTTGSKVDITDSSQQRSLSWDLAFTGPFNAVLYINYGGYAYNPGYGGPGKGAVIQVDTPYEQVTTAPPDAAFDASRITNIGWDNGNGTGWFFYSLSNHICVPISDRTFILRTSEGKYAKLQMINVYKGNPPVVTDLFWPAPYFTFRYFVQQDGSHNLK